jgi:hypothetical protein
MPIHKRVRERALAVAGALLALSPGQPEPGVFGTEVSAFAMRHGELVNLIMPLPWAGVLVSGQGLVP